MAGADAAGLGMAEASGKRKCCSRRMRLAAFAEMLEVIAKSLIECAKIAHLSAVGCALAGCL